MFGKISFSVVSTSRDLEVEGAEGEPDDHGLGWLHRGLDGGDGSAEEGALQELAFLNQDLAFEQASSGVLGL